MEAILANYVIWFVLGLGLLIAELLTGTFYLLMVAVGFAAGGIAALAGANDPAQLAIGAAVALALAFILRRTPWAVRRLRRDVVPTSAADLDVGARVDVHAWDEGKARVEYRGTQWDAIPEAADTPAGRGMIIKAIRGSTLVLGAS